MNEPPYTAMLANGGERSVVLKGWETKLVAISPDHATLAELVAKLLNEERLKDGGSVNGR